MLYTDWFYAIAPHHPVKMAVMIFFMEKYLKELSIILLLLFFGCSTETNISNFEDIFVKDIQVTCSLIVLNPSDLNAIRIRGDAYYELKKNEKAIADYSVLIDSGKEDYELFLKRGIALHAMGQYDRALADIDKSIELNPKNAWGYHRRADLLSALEKYDEALKNFSIVIGMIPTDPAAYTCRGRLYKKQKENEKALEEFNKAIEINPNHFYSL